MTATFVPETDDDRARRDRMIRLLAVGVDLSADVRVTTTTARPGGGDES